MSAALKKPKTAKSKDIRVDHSFLEKLEERIAPAALDGVSWKAVSFETPILVKAGEGISTGANGSGSYLLNVTKGQALVFISDLNQNGLFDPNEITGISAGNGLKLTSYVDINGDIVTNLNPNGTLTDLDALTPGNDGRLVLGSMIESVTIRALTAADSASYQTKLMPTTFSIYGNIIAGGGFGVVGGGLTIDTAGWTMLTQKYAGNTGNDYLGGELMPSVGYILTGSKASGVHFSFGATKINGILEKFTPSAGTVGGDIIGVKVGNNASTGGIDPVTGEPLYSPVPFQIAGLLAGDGGSGARGGDIRNVTLSGDTSGFVAYAGNGGNGTNGGNGGSIINFSDLGSQNGRVILSTGDGGIGFNGKGGNGGTISLGEFSTTGSVSLILGDGGAGTLGGGTGASLGSGTFTPDDLVALPTPLKIVSSYRNAGDLGFYDANDPLGENNVHQIDFNQDGIGDIVYISDTPGQLVVRLGVEISPGEYGISDSSPIYYLAGPIYSTDTTTPLAVGDFNGDGFLDIATASSAENSRDGLYIYLWDDAKQEFTIPLRSTVPFWNLTEGVSFLRSGGAITNIVVGDFNDDSILDIGFTAQYYGTKATNLMTGIVTMMGTGDGYFFADFQYDSLTNTINALPVALLAKGHGEYNLQATAVTPGDVTSDFLIAAAVEGSKLFSFDQDFSMYSGGALTNVWATSGKHIVPRYDDNTGQVLFDSPPTNAVIIDFTILDIDGDGNFDVLTLNDEGILVAFKGGAADDFGGSTGFKQIDNNKGIRLTGEYGVLGAEAAALNSVFKGIVTGNFDADPSTAEFAIYTLGAKTSFGFDEFKITGFEQNYVVPSKAPVGDVYETDFTTFSAPTVLDTDVVAYGTYRGDLLTAGMETGFVMGTPNAPDGGKLIDSTIQTGGGTGIAASESNVSYLGFEFAAGHGGDSQLGAGGAGGSIGNGVLQSGETGVTGGITLVMPRGGNGFSALFTYTGGEGGNGFTTGGAGGNVSGISARYTGDGALASGLWLVAGGGGDSIQAKAGNGGNVSKSSVETLIYAQGGAGGDGAIGGNGGSIIGNGSVYDATTSSIFLYAGDAGNGVTAGGTGGSITNFKAGFLPLIGGVGGSIDYVAGNGGTALAGKGGDGGSIVGMSPDPALNNLFGNISLQAGNGGNGLAGGAGGSITNFKNDPDGSNVPQAISFIAGNGGTGVASGGGAGGSITTVIAAGTGKDVSNNLLFNRFLAGQGGESYGAAGGKGGDINSINVSAQSASVAIAAGSGGSGLTAGGAGGSVLSSFGTAQGATSKVLVIAGDGGNAYGFLATSLSTTPDLQDQLLAFGGVNSVGGNGGNIAGFSATGQDVSTDLIAGNGGNLMNYGTALSKSPVGKGGSISNVNLDGNAGAMAADQAILSYNAPGTTMEDFVLNWLAASGQGTLTNAVGNVGVLVGAAGRVNVNASPATEGSGSVSGINGSVSNFHAQNIMSMVAGSVNRISAILSLTNVSVIDGGILGAYKSTVAHNPDTSLYYAGPNGTGGTTATANVGGSLIDGAILSVNKSSTLSGLRVFPK